MKNTDRVAIADLPHVEPVDDIGMRRRNAFDAKIAAWRRRMVDTADSALPVERRREVEAVTPDDECRQALDIVTSPVPHVCCLREKLALVHYFIALRGDEMDEYDRVALVGIGAVIADLCQLGH